MNCQYIKSRVLANPKYEELQRLKKSFVEVELYTDGPDGDRNTRIQSERFGTVALPLYVFLTPDGREIARLPEGNSLPGAADFVRAMRRTLQATGGPKTDGR